MSLYTLFEPFASTLMQRTLLAAMLCAIAASVVGVWVVLRGMSFLGDALAHGVLPGIAIASVLGVSLVLGGLVAALVMAVGIGWVRARSRLESDSAIGLLFVGMLSLGVIIISRGAGGAVRLEDVLFGSVVAVSDGYLWLQGSVAVLACVGAALLYRPLVVGTLSEDKAQVMGFRPRAVNGLLIGLVALCVVVSFQVVGALLVFGLLVGPPATAALLVKRLPAMIVLSGGLAVLEVIIGLWISYVGSFATGATLALVCIAVFFVVLALSQLRRGGAV